MPSFISLALCLWLLAAAPKDVKAFALLIHLVVPPLAKASITKKY